MEAGGTSDTIFLQVPVARHSRLHGGKAGTACLIRPRIHEDRVALAFPCIHSASSRILMAVGAFTFFLLRGRRVTSCAETAKCHANRRANINDQGFFKSENIFISH
jgi:hypothetical protein